jgi:hypothetical protein
MDIDKTVISDKRRLLSDAINSGWMNDFDLDESVVYIERWDEDDHKYKTFKHSFTMTDTKVDISDDSVEVIRTTDFKVVVMQDTDKGLTNKLVNVLDKYFGSSKKTDINIIKQFDDAEMVAIEPLYIAPGETDGHKHTMDLEGITSMVESLNKANDEGRLQSGLFHKHKTDVWTLDKAWVNPTECMIGDTLVPEGQPIAKTLFTSKAAYDMRIAGDIAGLSIGARAKEIQELNKDLSEIQTKVEPTHILKGVHFDWDHPELTYTSNSQGGAASLKNEAYEINKAKKAVESDLDTEQVQILKDIGEEFISLEKHLGTGNNPTPSSSSTEASNEGETLVTKGSKDMSENMVTRKEFVELQKALAVEKAVNSIAGYTFDTEINKAIAGAIASLNTDGQEAIMKAFDALVTRGTEAVEKAVEKSNAEAKPEESELNKALETEVGDGGEADEPVEKSLAERARDAQDKIEGAK